MSPPEEEMLEIFDSSGSRLDVPGVFQNDIGLGDHTCHTVDAIAYDITHLPDGEYGFFHRRSTAPAGFELPRAPWRIIDGEEMVRTGIDIRSRRDAGTARRDAGPPDASSIDAGEPDASPTDGGEPDAAGGDAGEHDASSIDAARPDASSADTGP